MKLVALSFALAVTSHVFADDGVPPNGCLSAEAEPHQVVVELGRGTSIDSVISAVNAAFPGVSVMAAVPSFQLYLLSAPAPICEYDLILALSALPGVEEAEFNEKGESSAGQTQSFFFAGLSSDFTDQYAWQLIGLNSAHDVTIGAGTLVAIIDSGLNPAHPLFTNVTILPGIDFVGDGQGLSDLGDGIDNDGDGAIDELAGHGSYVGGLIASVAPGTTILPLRALDSDGHGTSFGVALALVEAIAQGADIINLSFGSVEASSIVETLIDSAVQSGTVIVVAAGNGGGSKEPLFPATMPLVCAVAATDANDHAAPWSDTGSFVSLCAPGVSVVSCYPVETFAFASGTSVSAAFVSGAAALVRSTSPRSTAADVIATLRTTSHSIDAINPCCFGQLGGGRLDLAAAVGVIAQPADLNGDGVVNAIDLGILIGAWNTSAGDLNGDGLTDAVDLGMLIGAWTS